jgi:ATP-dependent Clp protease ATP-binding subunit ClpA
MHERFTDRARNVMQLANQEARRFNHEYIGTEHLLLGLIKEGSGGAVGVLKNLGVDPSKIRLEIEKLILSGPRMVRMWKLPQTPRAKKVIEYSTEEARNLNHNYVGSEHVLLGLLREQEGVAAQVLMNLGLRLEQVRAEIVAHLGGAASQPAPPARRNEIEDLPDALRPAIAELDAEIRRFTLAKEEAVANQDYELAARQRDEAHKLHSKRGSLVREWIARRAVDRSWLSANDGAALTLAQRISIHRLWDLLPNLADALELAGCTDAEIIVHCRQPGEHSNHCWVVDLLLAAA